MIDLAKLLLCITMVLTFPLPFFACRELLIVTLVNPFCVIELVSNIVDENSENFLLDPLLAESLSEEEIGNSETDTYSIMNRLLQQILESATPKNWLLPDDDRQLRLYGHVALTFKLWLVTTGVAIAAPSLGDVLDLVGCATGTAIAFVLPALLAFRLEGVSSLATILLVVGTVVGTFGTYFSVRKLFMDI